MGKTLQVIALVRGLQMQRETRKILIICPVAVLAHWRAEFKKMDAADQNVAVLKSGSKKSACKSVLLTTYGMVAHNVDLLNAHAWVAMIWTKDTASRTTAPSLPKTYAPSMRVCPYSQRHAHANNLAELWSAL